MKSCSMRNPAFGETGRLLRTSAALLPLAACRAAAARPGTRARHRPGSPRPHRLPRHRIAPPRTHSRDPLHHQRRVVDVGGHQPRWRDPRLRPARRPVHAARRGRHGDAAHDGARLREPAALQPGRVGDRLRVGPERGTEPVGDQLRRVGHDADHARQRQPVHVARVVAGRRLPGRIADVQPARRGGEAVALSPAGRERRGADRRAGQPQGHRRRLRPDGTLHLSGSGDGRLDLRRGLPEVPADPVRSRDRAPRDRYGPLRFGIPAGGVAGWGDAGLRHTPRGRDRAARPRPRHRRRTLAGLPRATRRHGEPGDARPAARLRLHAGRCGGRGLVWRGAMAGADGRGRPGRDRVRGGGRGARGAAPRLRLPGRGHADISGAADSRCGAVAGRCGDRVYGAGAAVRDGGGRGARRSGSARGSRPRSSSRRGRRMAGSWRW